MLQLPSCWWLLTWLEESSLGDAATALLLSFLPTPRCFLFVCLFFASHSTCKGWTQSHKHNDHLSVTMAAVDVIHHPFLLESFISSAFMMMQLLIFSVVLVMSLPNHHPPANHPRKPLCGFRVQLSALSLNYSIWKASSALSTAITCMSTQHLALPPSWTFSFHLFKTSLLGGSAITSYPVFLQNAFLPSLFPAVFPEAPYLLSALLSKCLISSWSPFLSSSPTLMFRPCCLTFLLGFPVSFVLWSGIWKVFLSLCSCTHTSNSIRQFLFLARWYSQLIFLPSSIWSQTTILV